MKRNFVRKIFIKYVKLQNLLCEEVLNRRRHAGEIMNPWGIGQGA